MAKLKILFVCLGNICRSPLAHGIMLEYIKQYNLVDMIEVDSAGTCSYHEGSYPDKRAISVAKKYGIELEHVARKFTHDDLEYYDFILAMDHLNYEDVVNCEKKKKLLRKVFRLRSFESDSNENYDVPDPYYGTDSDFDDVFMICNRSISGFLNFLIDQKLLHLAVKVNPLHYSSN